MSTELTTGKTGIGFFQRPEGKVGTVIPIVAAVAITYFFGSAIGDFIVNAVDNMFHLAIVGGALGLMGWLVLDSNFRTACAFLYLALLRMVFSFIQFATGSAEILPASLPTMNQLVDDIIITKYAVAVHGHTDNTGTPEGNMTLSEARAASVAAYLKRKGVVNVIRSYAHGQEEPIADNATAAGKAANRRVQIVLGTID